MAESYGRKVAINLAGRLITDLRVAFRVEKSLKPRPNQVELRVWNLSEQSRKDLIRDVYVAIEAGYQKDTSVVFVGNLNKVDHLRQGPDWVTAVRVGDGEKEIKKARVNTSFKPGTTPEQIVKTLTNVLTGDFKSKGFDVKLAVGNALDKARKGDTEGAIKQLSQGFVAFGSAFDELVKLGNNLGYDVSIQDKKLTLLAKGETLGKTDVLLNSATGLVGSPEQAEEAHIRCRAQLNGQLQPGGGVRLESRQFKGRYRIVRLIHTSDTHGPDWFTDLEMERL